MRLEDIVRRYGSYRDLVIASEEQWFAVGKKVIAQLPAHEFQPFIDWLERHPDMLEKYTKAPGEALRLWNESIERYLLEDDPMRVSEGL